MQRVMKRAEPNALVRRPIRPPLGVGLVLFGAVANVLWVGAILFGGYEVMRWFAG